VIHHVGLEVRAAQVDAEVAFWGLLGFIEVATPASTGARARWVEHDGQQIHLLCADEPVIAPEGHVAVVAERYGETIARLRAAGHDAAARAEHWGVPRTQVRTPAGHRVEVVAAAAET
jgi:catechol 2,3-dioxygenase-like lactoylglutathione lyase family enzyme